MTLGRLQSLLLGNSDRSEGGGTGENDCGDDGEGNGGDNTGRMNGTFNGLSLSNISSLTTTKEPSGFIRTSFRVPNQSLPKLEQILQLKRRHC